jgi:hypothetical protein
MGGGGGLHASDNGRDDDRPTEQVKGDSDKCSVFKELRAVMGVNNLAKKKDVRSL